MNRLLFNIVIILGTLLFSTKGAAQINDFFVYVEYEYLTQIHGPETKYKVNSTLICTKNESIFEIDHKKSKDNQDFVVNNDDGYVFKVKSEENDFVYKNKKHEQMYYSNTIGFKEFYIKDSLNINDWTLETATKTILGYTCQKATTSYGGRNYTAYFTYEIPITDGPWRFNGLPGLILEVFDEDKVFKMEATGIEIKNNTIVIDNPYKDKKLMSWQQFLKLYKKKYDEVLRNGMTEYGPTHVLAKKSIIEYIKE